MRVSNKGLSLIKEFEGCRLKAYLCPAGVWTIGYGSTGNHVKSGMVISQQEAEDLLRRDLIRFENGVIKALYPNVPLQEEFDAMVSLAFNIGVAGFSKSSVVRRYKAGDKVSAANAFEMWNKARVNGKLTVLKGLARRRVAEKQLFLSAGSATPVVRSEGNNNFVEVPEESVVPTNPKPLIKSREIILGSGLGVGGIAEIISNISYDELKTTKESIHEVETISKGTVLEELYIPEVAASLCVVIGLFMIWKRYKDRMAGIR